MYLNFPLLFAIPSIAFTMEGGGGILDQFDHERFFLRSRLPRRVYHASLNLERPLV